MNILRIEGLKKSFGKFLALGGIYLEVRKEEIRSIIGPNGAGKTTLFNVVTGKLKPEEGEVYFNGKNITGKPPYEIARYGIGRTFQIVSIFPQLTVLENIMLPVLSIHKKNMDLFTPPQSEEYITEESFEVLRKIGLRKNAHTLAGNLSHGDKKKLDMGIGLARDPSILLLDEPTAGLDLKDTQSFADLIREIAEQEKLTIVLIAHDMEAVFSISDSVTVFHQGKVIADGEPGSIRQNKLVIEAYLGEKF